MPSGIFTSAQPLLHLFYGARRWEAQAYRFFLPVFQPAFCAPPHVWKRDTGLNPERKGIIMNTIRPAFRRPLVAQPIRRFSTLAQASSHIDRLLAVHSNQVRFNIQQTAANQWVVCRVISGGVV